MSVLTTLMPGVRQLRTPLAVGSLWFVVIYFSAQPHWEALKTDYDVLGSISDNAATVPLIYALGALAFAAYVFGSVVQGLSSSFAALTHRIIGALEEAVKSNKATVIKPWRNYIRRREDASHVRSVVMDAVSREYSKAGKPPNVYLSFPFHVIEGQLDSMSLQLWQKAPDQYQESDRLSAESTFRVGVSLPLVAIGIALGVAVECWIAIPFAFAALVLVLQSRTFDRDRRALLANALYQGLITNATLDETLRVLGDLELPAKMGMPQWYAATVIAISRAGDIGAADALTREAAIEVAQEFEFDDPNWRSELETILDSVREIFNLNDNEYLTYYEDRVSKAQARAESAFSEASGSLLTEGDRPEYAARRAWNGSA